jgi:hypothetical protein
LKWLAATSAAGTPDRLAAAETYFFNRIGQKQPLGYLCKSWALHSTKKLSRVEICVYTLTVQKSGLALGVWCICHAVLLKLEHRFCLASITQKPYF